MRRWAAIAVALAMLVPMAWAGELAGVDLPDEMTVSDATLKLNGMGLRKKLWVKVYVAGLYLEQTTTDAATAVGSEQVKRVVMHFLTDKAKKAKMDAAWVEGFEKNSPAEFAALSDRVDIFKDYFGNMKNGDVIEVTVAPGQGAEVLLNGQVKGTIEGDDFAQALLRVWLGDEPPSEDLKVGMLGG